MMFVLGALGRCTCGSSRPAHRCCKRKDDKGKSWFSLVFTLLHLFMKVLTLCLID